MDGLVCGVWSARRDRVQELTLLLRHDRGKHHDDEVTVNNGALPDDEVLAALENAGPTCTVARQVAHGELLNLSATRIGLDVEDFHEGLGDVFANIGLGNVGGFLRIELIDGEERRNARSGTLKNIDVVALILRLPAGGHLEAEVTLRVTEVGTRNGFRITLDRHGSCCCAAL